MYKTDTPILLIIYKKIESTKKVFNTIREVAPNKLFIFGDGPRTENNDEIIRCQTIREWIITNINWDCEVKTLFLTENVGCGNGPYMAISWFFENIDEGIILEDDCLPNLSFFRFCGENLEKYRTTKRISIISGNNFLYKNPITFNSDYYFSIFPSTWGWATWKRTWEGFQIKPQNWSKVEITKFAKSAFKEKKYQRWWTNKLENISNYQANDIWDFQFHYHCIHKQLLAIIPSTNLVSNIGFSKMATHTFDPKSELSKIPTYEIDFPLIHPKTIKRHYNADIIVQEMIFGKVEKISYLKRLINLTKRSN